MRLSCNKVLVCKPFSFELFCAVISVKMIEVNFSHRFSPSLFTVIKQILNINYMQVPVSRMAKDKKNCILSGIFLKGNTFCR